MSDPIATQPIGAGFTVSMPSPAPVLPLAVRRTPITEAEMATLKCSHCEDRAATRQWVLMDPTDMPEPGASYWPICGHCGLDLAVFLRWFFHIPFAVVD